MDGNAGIRGESVEMTRSGFERCSKNEQPTLAIENSLFVQRFLIARRLLQEGAPEVLR